MFGGHFGCTNSPKKSSLHIASLQGIQLNFLFSLGYNGIGIPLAAGLFYALTGQPLAPFVSGGAMAMSSVSVVLSSLMLRRLVLLNPWTHSKSFKHGSKLTMSKQIIYHAVVNAGGPSEDDNQKKIKNNIKNKMKLVSKPQPQTSVIKSNCFFMFFL